MEDRVEGLLAVQKRNRSRQLVEADRYCNRKFKWELAFAEASEACLDRGAGWNPSLNEDVGRAKISERYLWA